jgi:hypothetical protein
VPLFLEQLVRTLRVEQTDNPLEGGKISNGCVALRTMQRSVA